MVNFYSPYAEATETLKNPTCLAVKDLTVTYGNGSVGVENISLDIPENQVTALIGPSGCGKSTFLRTLNRINDEFSCRYTGTVEFEGKNILDYHVNDLCRLRSLDVGYVMQKPVPFSGKTIFDDISLPMRSLGSATKSYLKEKVEDALRKVYLWDEVGGRLNTLSTELSGGQQQRLCIARAIVNAPRVLLLDEPCSALDPKSTFMIEALIKELKKEHTVVIVTHNMQQAQRVAEFTAFFYEGKVVEYDRTKQIFNSPKEELTKEYVQGSFS